MFSSVLYIPSLFVFTPFNLLSQQSLLCQPSSGFLRDTVLRNHEKLLVMCTPSNRKLLSISTMYGITVCVITQVLLKLLTITSIFWLTMKRDIVVLAPDFKLSHFLSVSLLLVKSNLNVVAVMFGERVVS